LSKYASLRHCWAFVALANVLKRRIKSVSPKKKKKTQKVGAEEKDKLLYIYFFFSKIKNF